jgi:hypothetical protein
MKHIKKDIRGMGSDYQTKFPRDKEGNLDPDSDVRELCVGRKVKFPVEVWLLMLGVSMKGGDGIKLPIYS